MLQGMALLPKRKEGCEKRQRREHVFCVPQAFGSRPATTANVAKTHVPFFALELAGLSGEHIRAQITHSERLICRLPAAAPANLTIPINYQQQTPNPSSSFLCNKRSNNQATLLVPTGEPAISLFAPLPMPSLSFVCSRSLELSRPGISLRGSRLSCYSRIFL
jgi:hypothetical protein